MKYCKGFLYSDYLWEYLVEQASKCAIRIYPITWFSGPNLPLKFGQEYITEIGREQLYPWLIGYDRPFWLKIGENRCRSSTSRLEYYNSPGSSHQTIRSPNHNQDQSGISSNNSATDSEMGFQIISISELDETLSPVDMSPTQQNLLESITNFWR